MNYDIIQLKNNPNREEKEEMLHMKTYSETMSNMAHISVPVLIAFLLINYFN